MQVNAETLQRKIEQLEYWGTCYQLTDKERYRLKAYKMLLGFLRQQCQHEWFKGKGVKRRCADCGKGLPKHD